MYAIIKYKLGSDSTHTWPYCVGFDQRYCKGDRGVPIYPSVKCVAFSCLLSRAPLTSSIGDFGYYSLERCQTPPYF